MKENILKKDLKQTTNWKTTKNIPHKKLNERKFVIKSNFGNHQKYQKVNQQHN